MRRNVTHPSFGAIDHMPRGLGNTVKGGRPIRIERRDPTLTYPRAVREEKRRLILPTRGTTVLFARRGGPVTIATSKYPAVRCPSRASLPPFYSRLFLSDFV